MNVYELGCRAWYSKWLITVQQLNTALDVLSMLQPDDIELSPNIKGQGSIIRITYAAERYTISISSHHVILTDGREDHVVPLTCHIECIALLKSAFDYANSQVQVQTIRVLRDTYNCTIKWIGDCCVLTIPKENSEILVRIEPDFTRVEHKSDKGELLDCTKDLATEGVLAISLEVDKFIAAKGYRLRPSADSTDHFSSINQSQSEKDSQDSMSELIERRDVMKAIQSVSLRLECPDHIAKKLYCAVASLPTVDAQPVAQGEWKLKPGRYLPYCSGCGIEPPARAMTSFCPNCGLKMDKPDTGV